MTKTELEEAIKNSESVWLATEYGIKELKKLKLKDGLLVYYNEDYKFNHAVEENYFDDLYKSQAEAEHYLHHANITRTEKLPFLTWEEFIKGEELVFIGKDKCKYILKIKDDEWKIILEKYTQRSIETEWESQANEKQFYLDYDECVKLFEGE